MYKKSTVEKATLFIYPFVSLFSIGLLALYLRAMGSPLDVVPFVMIGVIAWTFYDLCQRVVVYGILLDIWDYCLKHSMISTATLVDYLIGNSLFGLLISSISLLILNILSSVFFGFSIFSAGVASVISFIIIFIFAVATGLAINSIILLGNKENAVLVWSVPGIVMVFSGVYYPLNMLPGIIQAIAYILPTTYAIEAIRIDMGFSEGILWRTLLYGLVTSLIYLVFFYHVFERAIFQERKKGKTILS
ncbi:ABC transporter permease [archaeon]|nr:ABC transporter permease [Nanoarchaeota archaeon]MBU4300827.1 ABC transporter permease [Nanoarchaeota archaeon]MCG2723847.1 ABC transporter permease [archaeon]